MPLETEARAELRALVADFEPNDGKLMAALHRVQHRYGYISREALQVIAEQLEMFPAHVYGAASFYDEYRLEPPPQTTIRWCSGPACRLENANGIRDAMLATLGLDELGALVPYQAPLDGRRLHGGNLPGYPVNGSLRVARDSVRGYAQGFRGLGHS